VALMAGASFSMPMSGVLGALDHGLRRVRQTQELAEAIGEALVSGTQDRFEAEEAPDGTSWKPSIRARVEGGKTLTDTAGLKNSIGYAASPSRVVVGTNKVYAAIHQQGGTIKGKRGKLKFKVAGRFAQKDSVTIPARPYLGISAEDAAELRALQEDFLRQVLLGR
jgi:phage virion morphogenesis protein